MVDTGYGHEDLISVSASKRATSLPPKPLKSDYSQGSYATAQQQELKQMNLKLRQPTIKDAWRWIRSVVEDLTAFEHEKRLLKDFIKNLNSELQSLDIPQELLSATLTSGDQQAMMTLRSMTTSGELEAIIQKVIILRDYIGAQA